MNDGVHFVSTLQDQLLRICLLPYQQKVLISVSNPFHGNNETLYFTEAMQCSYEHETLQVCLTNSHYCWRYFCTLVFGYYYLNHV